MTSTTMSFGIVTTVLHLLGGGNRRASTTSSTSTPSLSPPNSWKSTLEQGESTVILRKVQTTAMHGENEWSVVPSKNSSGTTYMSKISPTRCQVACSSDVPSLASAVLWKGPMSWCAASVGSPSLCMGSFSSSAAPYVVSDRVGLVGARRRSQMRGKIDTKDGRATNRWLLHMWL